MKVSYSSNNSGGGWWLKDADWKALEDAGWVVEWGNAYFCNSSYPSLGGPRPEGLVECGSNDECPGHRAVGSYAEAVERREEIEWLGSLARSAWVERPSMREAMEEFERLTGQDVSDEGCNCCRAPHCFRAGDEWASGEECLAYLYPDRTVPRSIRDAMRPEAPDAKR